MSKFRELNPPEARLLEIVDEFMKDMDWDHAIIFAKRLYIRVYDHLKKCSTEHYLWGFINQNISLACGQLDLILKHSDLGISFETKADVQSFECKMNNYEHMKKENEMLKAKVQRLSDALKD